jgi:hypothetical protein
VSFFFNQFAEGPGIPKNRLPSTGLRLFAEIIAREWWDLVKLNLLFLAAALPLVTLPAAALAMTGIATAMVEDRNVWLWRDFRDGFLGRFRAATACGLALAALTALAGGATIAYAGAARDSLGFAPPLAVAATVLALRSTEILPGPSWPRSPDAAPAILACGPPRPSRSYATAGRSRSAR